MKLFFLVGLVPSLLTAQTVHLTEELGKTVLYGDIALSPDGKHVAWVQSTAATTSKQTYVCSFSTTAPATKIKIEGGHERVDNEPAWSPDSNSLAFLSAPAGNEQRQLWIVHADGSAAKNVTSLNGYAARPKWSRDGKQIAFLYIEGAGGGGPLMAAPARTGVVDTAFHNQRIVTVDVATGKLRQDSPPDLHIYDFDWSPDNRTFVATAAPGPGDNNWWIAQIYKIDVEKETATSIYKPSLQIAVPRWSPDGKSIAFIEGIMSDEGFHGGDLFTISADGGGLTNRTKDRKTSVSSFFWNAPDSILFTEYVGGGSAISELRLANNSVRTIWSGAEGVHASGNFPNFAVSQDGKLVAAVRSNYHTPPEVWICSGIGFQPMVGQAELDHRQDADATSWRQVTKNNATVPVRWGKAESMEWANDRFSIQGWMIPPVEVEPGQKYPMVVLIHGGPSGVSTPEWPAGFWNVASDHRGTFIARLLRFAAQSSRQLWSG